MAILRGLLLAAVTIVAGAADLYWWQTGTLVAQTAPVPGDGIAASHSEPLVVMSASRVGIALMNVASVVTPWPVPSTVASGPPTLTPGMRLVLVLGDLTTETGEGAGDYEIYINMPEDFAPDPAGEHFGGVVKFFEATKASPQSDGATPGSALHVQSVDEVIDVTDVLISMNALGHWSGGPVTVTFAPERGKALYDRRISIGSIELRTK